MSRSIINQLNDRFLPEDERLSRREMLKGMMATAASLMLSYGFSGGAFGKARNDH